MLEFYVNYSINSGPKSKRVQVGPFNNVGAATRQRATLENSPGISHCWVGISRDETRQLLAVEGPKVMQFVPAAIPTAA
ncbi:hypothetical protein [Dongia deserti]|uniref:hypothetical protein n=1 Tax=Dongia deserti TaxID=2268030 RepID=UPI0013C40943|nr:hypothetical protein [Dongia deserti]